MAFNLENIVKDVVDVVNYYLSLAYNDNQQLNKAFIFQQGKRIEINQIIQEFIKSTKSVFPLVWFVNNYDQNTPSNIEDRFMYEYESDISIFFICPSLSNTTKTEKAIKDNIDLILSPFVEQFIIRLYKDKRVFKSEEKLSYSLTKLAKVGSESNNSLLTNRVCDAILLEVKSIKVLKQQNC